MKFKTAVLAAVLTILSLTTVSWAGPILSLSTTAPDLSNLTVGQTIDFQVNLSGLGAGEKVDYLAVQVLYDSSLLSSPAITPGAIIPDVPAFAGSSFPGLADGNYDFLASATNAEITSNGVFFSVTVTVVQAGSGTLTIDVVASDVVDVNNDPLAPANPGPSINFTASLPTSVSPVPEPGSGLLVVVGITSLAVWRCWRRRRPIAAA